MSLSADITANIVAEHQRQSSDTGSPEVQVALLSKRIALLTEHLKRGKRDRSAAYGLSILVSKRRKLLRYLNGISASRYRNLISALGLRG